MLERTITIEDRPDSGESIFVSYLESSTEFQFITFAPAEEPPYYIAMADNPTTSTLANRLASRINERPKESLGFEIVQVSDNVLTIQTKDEDNSPVITTNSDDIVISEWETSEEDGKQDHNKVK